MHLKLELKKKKKRKRKKKSSTIVICIKPFENCIIIELLLVENAYYC